jgi:quercetin dioxygenase-like cupin family protein
MIHDAHVVVPTARFDDDLAVLTDQLGFRIDAIYPADSPSTGIVSGHGVRLRLERSETGRPITIHLLDDDPGQPTRLPGGTLIEYRPFTTTFALPVNQPTLAVSHNRGEAGVGRAGMRYRDLIPDRWGGRFIASHITIPDGGPVPDYVHFHKVRFQMIFVKSGWVRLVYEDQGEPFVMVTGDCVLQPPEIRHRVLESSAGLEVIEIGCPSLHETIADWACPLPTGLDLPGRDFGGQRFVRHVASTATYLPWLLDGWEYRDTGIGAATDGLAAARVARPAGPTDERWIAQGTEFAQLVVLVGKVTFQAEGGEPIDLRDGDSVAIPGGLAHRLTAPSSDTELLDVTLPASPTLTHVALNTS